MALIRWGFEEEEQKDPLTPTTTTIQSVQSGWQPTSGGRTNTLGDDGSDNSSSNQSQSYLMSEEKAQYDENMRQQRAAEEAARRQAAAEAAAQAAANAERARQAQAVHEANQANQAAQPQRQPGQKYANKSKKEEGGLWGFLKGIGAGIQQGIGAVGDIAIQGGAVLGSIGKNDQQLVKHMAEAERARKWLHNRRDITGNKFVGTRDVDQNASDIASGRGDLQDFMAVGGKSLQAGVDATMFMSPARLATKGLTPAMSQGANILARTARNPAVRYAARDAAFFGTLQGTATFQSVYGQTGDLEAATEAALKDAAIGGALQGTLDLAGSGVGVMANRTLNSLKQGRRYTPAVDAPRGVDDVPVIPQERTTPAVNTHQPTDGNVNFQSNTPEPRYTPIADDLTPPADGTAMPTRPEADMAEVPAPPVDPTLDPNTPPIDTPEVPADVTPVVADGVPAPVQAVPAADPNMPRIKSEEVRELQEARAGTTQAEEAEINQRLQEIKAETPNYFRDESEISDINRILKNEDTAAGGEPVADYYRRAKGEDWSVQEMTPDEYLDRAARTMGQDPQSWRNYPNGSVEEYAAAMRRGDKFPMPHINEVRGTQEGRTRALAAKAAGQEKMNVAVGKRYTPETPQIEADADVPVRLDDTETAVDSATRMKAIRDGDERYFDSGTEKVARERFDIPNLKKISSGGSDRDVYDLGDGNVLKVAKTKRGLIQNQAEIDGYAQQVGLIPETRENGLNYVVAEKVDPPDANTRAMVRQMNKIDAEKGRESAEMWEFLQENGLDDIMNYQSLWNDFTSIRNWGTRNGEPIHVDGGTLAGRDMGEAITRQFENRQRGIKNNNLDDPEFRKIYDRSRAAKKKFGDGDNATMYDKAPDLNSVKPEGEKYYHGTTQRIDKFNDDPITPTFLTKDKSYADVYTYAKDNSGKKGSVMEVDYKPEKPLDTSTDESARKLYNNEFLPYIKEVGDADSSVFKPLNAGEKIPFTTADDFYRFARSQRRKGNIDYDALVVSEGDFGGDALVPLSAADIKTSTSTTQSTFDEAPAPVKTPQIEADTASSTPYSGGLDDTHQTRINSMRRNADVMSHNAEITQRQIDSVQKSIDMWNEGGKVSPGLKATLTKEKSQAESYRKAQQILETSAPNRIYTTDAKGNVVEHPASHILEAFSKSVGEDMPPIVISGRPHDGKGMNFGSMTKNANGTYAHTLGVIKYKSKNSVYHETVHNIDMSIRDYRGDNPKMLKLQQLRKEITPAEIAKFRKLEGRVENDREYVAYAMEQLYDGRINANQLGTGVLKYIKEFFGEIKDAFSSSTRYNRPKFNDAVEYIKELDKAIHQVDKELTKRSKKPTTKAATPIKSKSTPKPATPKPKSGFVEPPPVQPTNPKSAPTPVKPKGVKPVSAPKPEPKPVKPAATKPKSNLPEGMNPVKPSETPAGSSPTTPKKPKKTITPEKQARKDFANVFTRSTDSNSDMGARLRNATGMTQENGSEVAQILADGGVTGKQAERITKLFDRAAEIAENNKATQKQYRKDFIKGGKEAIDDAPARQRNRETEEAAYLRNQLNSELKKLERKGDWGEKLAQDFENVISGKNTNQLIGAPIERGLTAEVIGNAMNTIKAPIRQIRGATKHGMPGKSAVKRLVRELKTPPKTVTEGYKYLIGNTYRAAMTPAQALADSRKGALRTELTKYAYEAKIGKTLSNSDAEKVSRMAGNDMEALVNMGAGVDNGTISILAYRKALKQWKKFIESGSEADYGKFMDTIDRQTSIVDKLAQGFSTQGKNRAQRAGLTLVNALLPYMRNAVNMSTRGVVLDLNPFTLSLLDGIRTDQRGFMSNLALGVKNKTVDYAVLAALGSVLTYNDGTDPDTVDQPRGVSIHLGGDEYFAIRGTPLELPLGAIMVAKQLAQDGVEGNFKDAGYYGGMITPSIPYVDYMTSHGNVIDSIEKLGTEEGDGGYAAKNFLVGNAKSLTPFSNNNIEASLSRFSDKESLTAKSVYDKDMGQWYLNSLANNNLGKVLPFVPDRSELKDSRDAAGRVRTVDNQGSWMRKKINDADTATYNDTITDLVKFAREEGLGKGTQDMFNTYPDGKDNNFKSVQDSITFFGVESGKSPDPADKLKSNEKLGELAAQIREGFYGDSGMDLLTLDGQELKSDASIPNKSGTKNSKLPLNMQSIKNAIAHTDLPEADRNRMYEISQANQELYAQRKAKVITYDQEQALKAENEKEYVAILSKSENYKKMRDLMGKLDEQGFFEKGGFGSTKSGQTYLWNSLNALLGAKGATPAANYPKDEKGFTPWGGGGKRGLKATIKPGKSGTDGIKWTPVGKRQMASVARGKYTPLDIRVKLGNEVKRDKTQNYSSRSF